MLRLHQRQAAFVYMPTRMMIRAVDIQEITRREYLVTMATALEKRLEMAPSFGIGNREKEIDDLLSSLKFAMSVKDDKHNKYTGAQDAVKLSERMIIAGAEGSNAEKRRAAAEEAMVSDKAHLALIAGSQEAQAEHEEADRDLVMLGRQLAAKRQGLDAQIGMLHFLAGGE